MYLFPNNVLKQNKTCKKSKIWIELYSILNTLNVYKCKSFGGKKYKKVQ